jgi:uncharacterized membrane protein (UPF0182 family)
MQDAYTTSAYFPYSQPCGTFRLNYIATPSRSSSRPITGRLISTSRTLRIRSSTYQRIFPTLFKPFAAMPDAVQRHIRYPEDFFYIQAQLYRTYHMDNPEVFYNREDLWQFPREQSGNETVTAAPYYIIMRLPGEPQAEFSSCSLWCRASGRI